jgi:hypothetical protein
VRTFGVGGSLPSHACPTPCDVCFLLPLSAHHQSVWVRRCGAGGRLATVNRNGGGLELGVGRVEGRRGEIESGTRCGGVLRC